MKIHVTPLVTNVPRRVDMVPDFVNDDSALSSIGQLSDYFVPLAVDFLGRPRQDHPYQLGGFKDPDLNKLGSTLIRILDDDDDDDRRPRRT